MVHRLGRMLRHFESLILVACLTACSGILSSEAEVSRATSPGGRVDAVLIEGNGGATTSYWYTVYLALPGRSVAKQGEVAHLYAATRSQKAYGVNLKWEAADRLVVEYFTATAAQLLKPTVSIAGDQVVISLRGGIDDHSIQVGGMVDDLERRRN